LPPEWAPGSACPNSTWLDEPLTDSEQCKLQPAPNPDFVENVRKLIFYCIMGHNRAAELGRKGGAGNRKVYDREVCKVPAPESSGDVKRMLAETMADIRAERMDPKSG
jgi:hypothetical protein